MSRKKLLILGATGSTGRLVLARALEAGHDVTVFARNPEQLALQHDRFKVVAGDVTRDAAALADATQGQDVVISVLGRGLSLKSTNLIQRSVPAIISAMQAAGVRRLIFTSALGVGDTIRDAPIFSRLFARVFLHDIYADKVAGEHLIRRSNLDWTLVQPSQLTNGPMTLKYRVGEHLKLSGIPRISRADVAHFIVTQIDDATYVRKVPLLSN